MSQSLASGGYPRVALCIDGVESSSLVHILVAEAFLGPRPSGAVINHIDGVKAHNEPSNLEYCTPRENSQHAARTGLAPSGERHGRTTKPERTARGESVNSAKLTADDVREARRLRAEGWTLPQLCVRFGIKKSAMHGLCTGKTWAHVS